MQEKKVRFFTVRGALLAAVLLLLAGKSQAVTLTVDCDAGGSLQAAINSLDLIGPHTINVTGTCRERPRIEQRDRLTIQAPPGQSATISCSGCSGEAAVVRIFRSRAITLRRLVVTGGGRGVFLRNGSEVLIESSRVENNSDAGVFLFENSTLLLRGTLAEPVRITNNGAGVIANGSFLNISGFTTIENNAGRGLLFVGGRSFVQGPRNIIQGNGFRVLPGLGGVLVQRGASVDLNGTVISNNFGPGVLAEFNAVVGLANTIVTNNTEDGVRVLRGAVATIGAVFGPGGPNVIAGNGGANVACDTTGLVVGDLTGITNINCMRIERELGPPRPGEIVDLPDPPEPPR